MDTMWKRLASTKSSSPGKGPKGLQEALVDHAAECNGLLKALAQKIDAGEDSQEFAEEMFSSLKALVVAFLGAYFGSPQPSAISPQQKHPTPHLGAEGLGAEG